MKISIVIFCYNRKNTFEKTINSLLNCGLINDFEIVIFSDGPKNQQDEAKVQAVRQYLKTIKESFQSITIVESPTNKGLATSVIEGVNQIFKTHQAVIVLEDDLIVSPNFLAYMNQALAFYENDARIFSISGYSPQLKDKLLNQDVYFSPRASSWGWATWQSRWQTVDWAVSTYPQFKTNWLAQWQFAKGGIDLPGMLRDQMKGNINSWAIRWVYQQFLNKQATVYPRVSKVKSIGFGEQATHTKKTKRFDTLLDQGEQTHFSFKPFEGYDQKILKSFRSTYSIWRRLKDKL